jgi:hypothetical protein
MVGARVASNLTMEISGRNIDKFVTMSLGIGQDAIQRRPEIIGCHDASLLCPDAPPRSPVDGQFQKLRLIVRAFTSHPPESPSRYSQLADRRAIAGQLGIV